MTKELFVSTINSLREQMEYDLNYGFVLAEALRVEINFVYDNSILIKSIIRLLQIHFKPIDGFCEIEHYCFSCNFGKFAETDYMSPEQLYEQLNKAKSDEFSRIYKEERMSCECRKKQTRCAHCHCWEYKPKPPKN